MLSVKKGDIMKNYSMQAQARREEREHAREVYKKDRLKRLTKRVEILKRRGKTAPTYIIDEIESLS